MRFGLPRLIALMVPLLGLRVAAQSDLGFLRAPIVCFPPTAPIFGEEIAAPAPGIELARRQPPEELSEFVAEYFYPALSSRMIDKTLGAEMQARLEAYRAKRNTLLNELADQLLALHTIEEAQRVAHLRTFADQQSPRIVALEKEAEELRRELIGGGLLRRTVDWSRERPWQIGRTAFGQDVYAREAEFQVVRAAAYYHDDLMPEQRGLLVEAAAELRKRARAARPIPAPRRDDASAFFFSPETSRLRLPPKAPGELAAKIGRYNQLKMTLTKELVEAVLQNDAADAYDRPAVFKRLADRQWSELAELDKLAEEIRVALAALPPVKLASPPYVPATLIARIDGYLADRKKIMKEFDATMRAASELVENPRFHSGMTPEERARRLREIEAERSALRAKVAAAFQEAAKDRLHELRGRYDRIQGDLTMLAAGQVDPDTGRPLDAEGLLRTYSVAMERFATFGREEVIYRGYRTAMLMPGLSREQRRLLFSAAIRGLAQPLPFGEPIPTGPLPVPRS